MNPILRKRIDQEDNTVRFISEPSKPYICEVEVPTFLGDYRRTRYAAPRDGGYVRSDGRQVCDGLGSRGVTIEWTGQGHLVNLIRKHYMMYNPTAREVTEAPDVCIVEDDRYVMSPCSKMSLAVIETTHEYVRKYCTHCGVEHYVYG